MRAESTGLADDQTELVTRIPVSQVEDGQPRLRSSTGRRGIFRFFSPGRSTRSNKSKTNVTVNVEYAPVPGNTDDGEDAIGADGDKPVQLTSRVDWAWCGSLLVRFWLIVSYVKPFTNRQRI